MVMKDGIDALNVTLPNSLLVVLTKREWAVLMQLTDDSTNKEISETLSITPKSVENYRARIGSKLGLKGARSLSRFVHRHIHELRLWYAILSPPPPCNILIINILNKLLDILSLFLGVNSIKFEGLSLYVSAK